MYEDEQRKFMEGVNKYKSMGINPLSLATGCAVKVDLIDIVYPAIKKIKEVLLANNIEISPREDADIFISQDFEIKRLINGGNFDADRAVSLIQVNQKTGGDPELFSQFLLKTYLSIKTSHKLIIGKGHSIITSNPNGEVAVIDAIRLKGNTRKSYTLTNNDTIQIIDPVEEPTSYTHTQVAISNSLNDLFAKGTFKNIKIIPVYDSPDLKVTESIRNNFVKYSQEYKVELVDEIQPTTGTFMQGATVIGETDHELPTFYGDVEPGMKILVTRPMGELTPINLYMWLMINPDMIEDLEKTGISVGYVSKIKHEAIELMAKPNFDVAKVIYEHLPEFGKTFDPNEHIAMTTDVSGPGVFVVKEFADKAGVTIRLDEIPVIDKGICKFSTENFVIPNSTAGTNGGIVIFAKGHVIDEVAERIHKAGGQPSIIGEVVSKSEGKVIAPQDIAELIVRKNILGQFEVV
ncbi:selenophosphate synthetase [Sulfolobales archaeon HS-7]|nr:selenophosphate synthetase [Sulfolobales archaeon HS-7]